MFISIVIGEIGLSLTTGGFHPKAVAWLLVVVCLLVALTSSLWRGRGRE